MLRHDEVTFWILIDLEESDDIRVIHSFEDFNFLQESGLLFALEKTLLNNLDRPFSASLTMCAETNFTESTGAKDLSNKIIVSDIFSIVNRNECLLTKSDLVGTS